MSWCALLNAALFGSGLGIIWTCLCRIKVMTAKSTLASVRYSIALLATAGLVLVLTATVRPGWLHAALVLLAVAVLCVQAATSRLWRRSVPESFSRPMPLDSMFFETVPGGKKHDAQ